MELLSLQKLFRLLTHSVNGKFQDPPGDKIISIKKHKLGQNKNRNPTGNVASRISPTNVYKKVPADNKIIHLTGYYECH